MAMYKIKIDHVIDGSSIRYARNKQSAMRRIREILDRVPYVKIDLFVLDKDGIKWKPHSHYEYNIVKKL